MYKVYVKTGQIATFPNCPNLDEMEELLGESHSGWSFVRSLTNKTTFYLYDADQNLIGVVQKD